MVEAIFGSVALCIQRSDDESRERTDRERYTYHAHTLLAFLATRLIREGIRDRADDSFGKIASYLVGAMRAYMKDLGDQVYHTMTYEDTNAEEMRSLMAAVRRICPFTEFGHVCASTMLAEEMLSERKIHIIDFKIQDEELWVKFLKSCSRLSEEERPSVRITAFDCPESVYDRAGETADDVGNKLVHAAMLLGVPFEFEAKELVAGFQVELKDIAIHHGEAVAVNLPFVMKLVPDGTVIGAQNHRDRILQLVKSLSPKVVTLVEQESGTNDANYFHRFLETVEYYTYLMDCIVDAEQGKDYTLGLIKVHWIGRQITSILGCKGADRVHRAELYKDWSRRFTAAGFAPMPLTPNTINEVQQAMVGYSENYSVVEGQGEGVHALFLRWKNRALLASSAWN